MNPAPAGEVKPATRVSLKTGNKPPQGSPRDLCRTLPTVHKTGRNLRNTGSSPGEPACIHSWLSGSPRQGYRSRKGNPEIPGFAGYRPAE